MAMICENGFLQTVATTGGGMLHGIPQSVGVTAGDRIPANIKTVTHNRRGKTIDGQWTVASYVVLIDIDAVSEFTARKVVLTDNRGKLIGEFDVQDCQHLDYAGVIEITV